MGAIKGNAYQSCHSSSYKQHDYSINTNYLAKEEGHFPAWSISVVSVSQRDTADAEIKSPVGSNCRIPS